MIRASGIISALLLVIAFAGCAPQGQVRAPPPPSPSATPGPAAVDPALQASEWQVVSLRNQDPVAGTQITLEFSGTPDGTPAEFDGYTGCNHYGGQWATAGEGRLHAGPIEVTLELCPGAAGLQEQAYIDALTRAAGYRLSGDRLELLDAAGQAVLVYSRQPQYDMDPAALIGTQWQLVAARGCASGEGPPATLAFLDGQWLTWRAGCLGYVAAYNAAGDDLGLSFIAALPPDCPERLTPGPLGGPSPSPEGEPSPGAAAACGADLEGVTGYRLAENRLELLTEGGQTLRYEPVPAADLVLEGLTWSLLASIEAHRPEGESAVLPMPAEVISGTKVTLSLDGATASGSAGCNTFRAAYARGRPRLTFGPIVASKHLCLIPAGTMAQEQRYLALLAATVGYQVIGDQIWLYTAGGPALVYRPHTAGASPSPVPDAMLRQADQIASARVGRAFFEHYYTFDPSGSSANAADPGCVQDPANCAPYLLQPHYRVAYFFRVPGQSGLTAGAGLTLDASGTLVPEGDLTGLPDCAREPQECLYLVDEADALAIAQAAGLEQGLGRWQTRFHWWAGEPATFVWTVDTTLTVDDSTGQSSGRTAVIDANSGVILEIADWQAAP